MINIVLNVQLTMRLLSEDLIDQLLPLDLAIDSADEAFRAFSGKTAQIPLRSEIHRDNPKGTALIMSGLIGSEILGVKLVGSVLSDQGTKKNTCMMLIWDARNLKVRGLIAADRLNEHRTAAGFASATRRLARLDASNLLVIGAGKLAFSTVLYIAHVRPLKRVYLASRSPHKLASLAARLRADSRMAKIEIITDVSIDNAVSQSDILTTVTTSAVPVFDGAQVRFGTHINLGGAGRANEREMDDFVASRSSIWMDSTEACRLRTGDVILPLKNGAITENNLKGEIGEVLLDRLVGRKNVAEITVFKSLGIASQDLVLGARLLDLAEMHNAGVVFDEING